MLTVPDGGKRSYRLTEAGRQLATAPGSPAPWDEFETVVDPGDDLLRTKAGHLLTAVDQVVLGGTHQQKTRVSEVLAGAPRSVFTILAEQPGT